MNRVRLVFLLALIVLVSGCLASCGGLTQNTAKWHLDQGKVLVVRSHYDQAIEECTKAIDLDPRLAKAYFWRAIAYYQKMQYDLAIGDYNKAIELDPNLAEAYINRAAVYCEKMRYDLAIADCDKVIDIDSSMRAIAYLYRGFIHARMGEHDLAIADRDKAISIDRNLVYSAMSLIYYI